MKYANICNMDTQGRIVIPAAVRRFLNIEDGETLEMELINEEIRLRKCGRPLRDLNKIHTYLGILYSTIHLPALICSSTQVLAAKGVYIPQGTRIPDALSALISKGNGILPEKESPIYMMPHIKDAVSAIFPIRKKDMSLVLLSQKPLTEAEIVCTKLVANTLGRMDD